MINVVVAGMGKERIAELVQAAGGGQVEARAKTDFEAASAVKSGKADYYIGACQSGAGGALGVANAILGSDQVVRLSGVGSTADPDDVRAAVASGRRAFGISYSQMDAIVPVLVGALLARGE
jgi:hypothetical protein